ncbi:hypothetical protein [uncultured Sphaerotilus sp.]|uniref:hypothetical protein n=1 Tax=uncultured Sphaerotilus sp. TaxID=474984 RepID=UPI0030CA1D46
MKWVQASYNPILNMKGGLAQGNLTQEIATEYSGMFRKMKEDANATIRNLAHKSASAQSPARTSAGKGFKAGTRQRPHAPETAEAVEAEADSAEWGQF